MSSIYFYNKDKPYFEFSNYYPSHIVIDEREYTSVEVYFQAQKFYNEEDPLSMEYFILISFCDSPQKAKDMGCQKVGKYGSKWLINKNKPELGYVNTAINKYKDVRMRSDWESVKEDIMYRALYFKFKNARLQRSLLDTFPSRLFEDSPRDSYWGLGQDGKGKNRLGELLMELRQELINSQR
jgi:predicted NAD-dependent protein-ADP-ribosyltransferase YbiA (DUF1768 family)